MYRSLRIENDRIVTLLRSRLLITDSRAHPVTITTITRVRNAGNI